MQGDALQLLDHEESVLVLQGVAAADGCLAHSQLLLVEAGVGGVEEAVGVACLRDGAAFLHARHVLGVLRVHRPFVDAHYGVAGIVLFWLNAHPRPVPRVARVACHHRAIHRCLLAHHDACAGISLCLCLDAEAAHAQEGGSKNNMVSHCFRIFFPSFI